jgi:hypothetical protein
MSRVNCRQFTVAVKKQPRRQTKGLAFLLVLCAFEYAG